jgi:hypothetical protein
VLPGYDATSGYYVFIDDLLVAWSSKRQMTVSRSSAEAKYHVVANATIECCWLRQLLQKVHVIVNKASIIYYDNISTVYLSRNPVHHRRMKHMEIDIHFVREKIVLGELRVVHVPTNLQFMDIMTKGLPTSVFEIF